MEDTLSEIDLDEWNSAFVGALTQQLNGNGSNSNTYQPDRDIKEKAFLMKATGR